MSSHSFRKAGCYALTIAIASVAAAANAQDVPSGPALEEIVVQAQRRTEASQDVPISITTLSATALADAGIAQVTDIQKLTPGLRFDRNSAFVQPSIRGVGNAVVSSGSTSNVGIYVDGFYVPNPLGVDFQLMKLENVQVVKGPQGTLFGRNTTGGAILVSSTRPSTETQGTVEASYGSYNATHVGAYATTGLTDKVAVDVEALSESGDWFTDNIVTGNDDDMQYDNWTGRLGLAVDFSDNVNVLLRYTHHDVDDPRSIAYNTAKVDGKFVASSTVPESSMTADPDEISVQLPSFVKTETDSYQMTFEFDLDFATLTSYTQYREDDTSEIIDNDGTGALVTQLQIDVQDETTSQEFLLVSNGESNLQWTAGLFYFDYEDTFNPVLAIIPGYGITDWAQIAGSTTTSISYAGFLDVTYQILDGLYLTAGARYSRDEVEDAAIWVAGDMMPVEDYDDNQLTPRVVLRYELDDYSSVYASYTKGYKAGFLDVANPPPAEEVEPEEIDAFEVGYKYAGDRLGAEVAAFYYDYQDLQVSIYPGGTAITVNAATAEIQGMEGQLRYAVTSAFEVSASVAWTDAEYEDFPNYFRFVEFPALGIFVPTPHDSSGAEMQRTPEFSGALSARYETGLAGGQLALSGNLYYSSSFYFDAAEVFKEDAYTTLGLRAAWTDPSERYTLALYGDNVTDEEYRTQVSPTFSGTPAVWAPPATIAGSVRVNF